MDNEFYKSNKEDPFQKFNEEINTRLNALKKIKPKNDLEKAHVNHLESLLNGVRNDLYSKTSQSEDNLEKARQVMEAIFSLDDYDSVVETHSLESINLDIGPNTYDQAKEKIVTSILGEILGIDGPLLLPIRIVINKEGKPFFLSFSVLVDELNESIPFVNKLLQGVEINQQAGLEINYRWDPFLPELTCMVKYDVNMPYYEMSFSAGVWSKAENKFVTHNDYMFRDNSLN